MAKKVIIKEKQQDGSLLELLPKTTASQVIEETNKKFTTDQQQSDLTVLRTKIATDDFGQVDDVQLHDGTSIVTNKIAKLPKIATLGDDGKVPTSQLPSYVDDVLEYDAQSAFPSTGETGKIYVAKDTNKTYRWSGTAYTEISASLALGETSSTAYAGDKGKTNADNIAKIVNGTTKIGKSETADKLSSAKSFAVTGDATGSVTSDLSNGVSIPLTLSNSGVTAGTYSALTVDAKGRATAGGQSIAVGASAPSDLVIGGLFFEEQA